MNDFTKEELQMIYEDFKDTQHSDISERAKLMLDNYKEDPWNTKKIAESHLREAESLISHAMCLLDMKEEV